MANSKVTIPTLSDWGEMESRIFYKGTQVSKANKSTSTPKAGTSPLFHYVNKAGVQGDWYDVKDLTQVARMSKEDKGLLRDLNKQRTELFKGYRAHEFSREKFLSRDEEIETVISDIEKQYA